VVIVNFWTELISQLVSAIMSIADASNLRNRVYQLKEEHELMWTCLDDIARMNPEHKAGQMAKRTLEQIDQGYGR